MQAQSVGLATGSFDAPLGEARRGVEQSAGAIATPHRTHHDSNRFECTARLLPKLR